MLGRSVCTSTRLVASRPAYGLWRSRRFQGEKATPPPAAPTSPIIGIDLGTTNSCVAAKQGEDVVVFSNAEGERTMPSMVSWDKEGNRLVGLPAKRSMVTNPKRTLYVTKRFIGRRYADAITDLRVPFQVIDKGGDAWMKVDDNEYSPSAVAAMILEGMKNTAEASIYPDGEGKITRAVITVPAYFNDQQRTATKDAGAIAGLKVERIINEPTAAALAYGLQKSSNGTVAVFDMGGGTFDISILDIANGVFEVKATNGDTFLGGEDADHILVDDMYRLVVAQYGEPRDEQSLVARLREQAERAKKELDHQTSTMVDLPFIPMKDGSTQNFSYELTRQRFEELIDPLCQRALEPCKKCCADAGIAPQNVEQVILVGGMTRTPKVVDTVQKFFKREPFKGVNPDEVVAAGAAIQGSILIGETKGLVLMDITPLSLGTEVHGGVFSRIINRNTRIPCKEAQEYTTVNDSQTNINVKVFQGEREMAAENKLLGEFVLDGLPPLPKGQPKIEITFSLDSNGILLVEARDKFSNAKKSLQVNAKGGLSSEEVEKMIRDAELNKELDAVRSKVAELRRAAEDSISSAENYIASNAALQSDAELQRVLDALQNKADESLASNADKETLMAYHASLEQAQGALNNKLLEIYRSSGAGKE